SSSPAMALTRVMSAAATVAPPGFFFAGASLSGMVICLAVRAAAWAAASAMTPLTSSSSASSSSRRVDSLSRRSRSSSSLRAIGRPHDLESADALLVLEQGNALRLGLLGARGRVCAPVLHALAESLSLLDDGAADDLDRALDTGGSELGALRGVFGAGEPGAEGA